MGSVFSPYYARARRKEEGVDPLRFCAFNVALYGVGGPRSWAFNEYPGERVLRSPSMFVVGESGMEWADDRLVVWFDEPGSPIGLRLKGSLEIRPQQVFDTRWQLDPSGHHHWRPIAPISEVQVSLDKPGVCFSGHGYFDSNWGEEPLEAAFRDWNWSRARLEEGTAILYDVVYPDGNERQWGRLYCNNGTIEDLSAPRSIDLGRGLWRVDRATRSDAGGQVKLVQSLEDTPFYTRSVLETELLGQRVPAVHESLDLRRFDSSVVQHLLTYRMRRRA